MSTTVTSANIFNTTSSNNDFTPRIMMALLNALQGVVLSFSLYLLVVLLIYERSLRTSSSTIYAGRNRRSSDADTSRRIGKYLRLLCIASAGLCVFICVNDLVFYNSHAATDSVCSTAKNMKLSLLTMLDVTIYLFLWFRQYVIYQNLLFERRVVQYLIICLKWLTLGFIGALFLVTNSLLACCRRHDYDEVAERCTDKTPRGIHTAFGYIWTGGSITLHCTLLMMFGIPLMRLKKTTTEISLSSRRMTALVRRCCVIAAGCVITDVLVMVLAKYILTASPLSPLRNLLYNMNVLLNSTLIVASFIEWKQMLMPWRKVMKARRSSESNLQAMKVKTVD